MLGLWIPLETMGLAMALSVGAAGPRFQLQSEKWINLAPGGGSQSGTFTAHTYDPAGNRVRTQVFTGLEAAGEPSERIEYSYFPDGFLEAQSNYQAEGLESRVAFLYDGQGQLNAKVVSGADGAERFRDTYGYDAKGRVFVETRIKGDVRTFLRRKSYAADGSLETDSLFEADGSAMVAVQAAIHGEGRMPGEKSERRFRNQDGVWYHVLDTYRLYEKGLLAHAAAYEVGGKRTDSTAFSYDAEGNRVQEDSFTGAGIALSRLVLAWKDLQTISIRRSGDVYPRLRQAGPLIILSGRDGAGWRHLGADILGRGKQIGLNPIPATGR